MSAPAYYWLVEYKLAGGHVHITLRCGRQPHSRAKAGDLIVTVDEWNHGCAQVLNALPNVEFRDMAAAEEVQP